MGAKKGLQLLEVEKLSKDWDLEGKSLETFPKEGLLQSVSFRAVSPGIDNIVGFLENRVIWLAETILPGAGLCSHFLLY